MKKIRTDVLTIEQRSYCMSRIKSKNTQPELQLKQLIKDLCIPFKQNYRKLSGSPDIYIPELNLVFEVRGCFWHGHKNCHRFKYPKSNAAFWANKINRNVFRDKINIRQLNKIGIRTCIVWECEFRNSTFFDKVLNVIVKQHRSTTLSPWP